MKYVPLCIAAAIFFLDVIEKVLNITTPLTLYLWVLGLVTVSAAVFYPMFSSITKRTFWTWRNVSVSLAVIILMAGILGPQLTDFYKPLAIHPESARQAACAIGKVHQANGSVKVAYSWCFLGYNTRQYIPQALLFEALGPSVFALNLPYIYFVVVGMLSFVTGLKIAVNRGYGGLLLLLVALVVPIQSYYYFFLTFAHEQSVFPYALTLLTIGFLLRSAFSFSAWNVGLTLLALQYLLFSYTPAISVYFFCAGVLALQALGAFSRVGKRWITCMSILLYTGAHFLISLAHRADIRLMEQTRYSRSSIESTLTPLLKAIFDTQLGKEMVFSNGYFMAVVAIGMCLIFWFRNFRLRILGIAALGWGAGHILLAAYSKGYAAPPIPFALHRALPVLPVLGLIIFFGYGQLRDKRPKIIFTIACALLLCGHLVLGWHQSKKFDQLLQNRRAHIFPYGQVLNQIYSQLPKKVINHLTLGEFLNVPHSLPFPDYASYYFPDAEHTRSQVPVVPPRHKTTYPFVGLFIGGRDEVEPYVSGVKALPEGLRLGSVIHIEKLPNASQPIIAYTYERISNSEMANPLEK